MDGGCRAEVLPAVSTGLVLDAQELQLAVRCYSDRRRTIRRARSVLGGSLLCGAVRCHAGPLARTTGGIRFHRQADTGPGCGAAGPDCWLARAPPLRRAVHGSRDGDDLSARLHHRAGIRSVTDADLAA